jgi:hypothetical protein
LDSTNTHRTVVTSISDSAGIHKVKTDTIIKQTSETIVIKKDINVDWITPVTKIISDFTWPIVVVIVLILFRDQIAKFIEKLKSVTINNKGVILDAGDAPKDRTVIGAESLHVESKKDLSYLLTEPMVNKVLSTFWKNQKNIKSENNQTRWSFTIPDTSAEFHDFIAAINTLYKEKLVTQNVMSQQFYLTYDGVEFCNEHKLELNSDGFKI